MNVSQYDQPRILETVLLESGNTKDLDKEIVDYLRDGWSLYGDPLMCSDAEGEFWYAQRMVLYRFEGPARKFL